MAIVQNPLIGQTKGKVGNVIFYKSFNNNIIRSKPIHVANPRTPAQVSSRSMFKLCQSFIAKNLLLFRDTCQSLIDNNSVYIAAIKYYMNEVAIKENDIYKFDLTKMIFSAGELTNIAAPTLCTIDENFDISVTWNDNTGTGTAAANDIINFILFNVTTDIVKQFTATRETSALEILQTESGIAANDEIALFYFASNASRTIFSNTAPATLTEAAPEPQALEITWDDIANAPARTLEDWNTYFDLPAYGTAFTSFEEIGNVTKLYGGQNITIKSNMFNNNTSLIGFNDNIGCILHVSSNCFLDSLNIATLNFPALLTIGNTSFITNYTCQSIYFPELLSTGINNFKDFLSPTYNFPKLNSVSSGLLQNAVSVSSISLPSLSDYSGDFEMEEFILYNIMGCTITLTIPHSLSSNPNILNLISNNTVTVIYSD